jgi:hypothetical protein
VGLCGHCEHASSGQIQRNNPQPGPFPLHKKAGNGTGIPARRKQRCHDRHRGDLRCARAAAITMFIGFNLIFFPQFVMGYLGMPRRYHIYPPEFQVYHVLSTAGAAVLGVAYFMRLFENNALNRLAAAAGPIWVFVMFLLMGADYFTR